MFEFSQGDGGDTVWIELMVPHLGLIDISKNYRSTVFLELLLQEAIMIGLCSLQQYLLQVAVPLFHLGNTEAPFFIGEIYQKSSVIAFPLVSVSLGVHIDDLLESAAVKLLATGFLD